MNNAVDGNGIPFEAGQEALQPAPIFVVSDGTAIGTALECTAVGCTEVQPTVYVPAEQLPFTGDYTALIAVVGFSAVTLGLGVSYAVRHRRFRNWVLRGTDRRSNSSQRKVD